MLVPAPGADSMSTLPPINSPMRRLIANPSPVPPKRRVVSTSACENGWNSRACACSLMPMPVSVTRITSASLPKAPSAGSCRPGSTATVTAPCSVNLIAFDRKLPITWRTRTGSA